MPWRFPERFLKIRCVKRWPNAPDGQIESLHRKWDDEAIKSGEVALRFAAHGTSLVKIKEEIPERDHALLLACSYCNTPRRHVYGWEWDSFLGMVKQSQVCQLAMPLMRPTSLLFRGRLSASNRSRAT